MCAWVSVVYICVVCMCNIWCAYGGVYLCMRVVCVFGQCRGVCVHVCVCVCVWCRRCVIKSSEIPLTLEFDLRA